MTTLTSSGGFSDPHEENAPPIVPRTMILVHIFARKYMPLD